LRQISATRTDTQQTQAEEKMQIEQSEVETATKAVEEQLNRRASTTTRRSSAAGPVVRIDQGIGARRRRRPPAPSVVSGPPRFLAGSCAGVIAGGPHGGTSAIRRLVECAAGRPKAVIALGLREAVSAIRRWEARAAGRRKAVAAGGIRWAVSANHSACRPAAARPPPQTAAGMHTTRAATRTTATTRAPPRPTTRMCEAASMVRLRRRPPRQIHLRPEHLHAASSTALSWSPSTTSAKALPMAAGATNDGRSLRPGRLARWPRRTAPGSRRLGWRAGRRGTARDSGVRSPSSILPGPSS
jgi:hypothetical protein